MNKNKYIALVLCIFLLTSCAGPEASPAKSETFVDSAGREVAVPAKVTRIAPSGSAATMILATIAPEYFVCIHSGIGADQAAYLPSELVALPETGQLYGGKGDLNKEALLATEPQIIIDMGDYKNGIADDMDALQEQTGIPTVFIQADLSNLAQAYRMLGQLLDGKLERGEELAQFVEQTLATAESNSASIADNQRRSVMYVTGNDGVHTNAAGSTQMQVLDLIGAANAVVLEEISNKGGGSAISMEQVYRFDPDILLFTSDSYYATAGSDPLWTPLRAVAGGAYYQIPDVPYNWLCTPTSVNMLLGIWWAGNLIYPEVYDYDMTEKAAEIYSLLWGYQLSHAEASEMLSSSTHK